MKKEENIRKWVKNYKLQQATYRDFADTVKSILEALLDKNEFRHQIVSSREKSVGSLEEKLRSDKEVNGITDVNEIDDLAACRIIFYLESDIQRFAQYIYQNFKIIKQNLKYSPSGYNALHLVVKLNKDRLKITEYSKFENLKCEIQLTTVLYHAWSEMSHNIIYKPPKDLSEFDQQAFKSLEERFSDVMKNHIKEAQYTFDFIAKEIKKIEQGKKVFDLHFLKGISQSKSNNEIHGNLKLLHQYVQKFGDKTPKELDIIGVIKSVLKKSKTIKTKPIKTVIGDLGGYTYANIAVVSLDILDQLRYSHTEKVFPLLIQLSRDSECTVKKKALKVLSDFSGYKLHALEKIGYYPQLIMLNKIEGWDDKNLIENFESEIEMTRQFLQPSFEGHSMQDYKTFTFRFGPLPVSDKLKDIRRQTMNLLKKLYSISKEVTRKKRVLDVLQEATQTPRQGNYGEDMKQMVLADTNDLIDYYVEILPKANNEIIKDIEEQTHWFIRRFGKERLPKIDNLQSLIASNTEYEMFRILVGYDRRSLENLDRNKIKRIRKDKIQEFIDGISEKNVKEWERRILSISSCYSSSSPGEFQYFNIFLFELGRQKSDLALELIQQNEKKLKPFLVHLIAGIWKSKRKKVAKDVLSIWVEQGKHLSTCAYIFGYVEEVDKPLIEKIFKKAKYKKDIQTFNNIIYSIVRNYPKYKNLKPLFVDTINELTKNNNFQWIDNVWYCRESLFKSLTEKDFDVVLENLLLVPDVDYRVEEILAPIAEKCPQKVISFFEKRVTFQVKDKRSERYNAIPFDLHVLNKPLQKQANTVVVEVLKWFSKKGFQWEASRLLQVIFPSFNRVLEQTLIKLIKDGGKKNAKIVLTVLRAYKGEVFLHNVCKEFVKKYPKNKRYKNEMFIILSQTGVVTGEYGFVEAYNRKKKEIQNWKKDKNKAIQSFIKEYEDYLTKQIAYEQKRADEDIELRKRSFDS